MKDKLKKRIKELETTVEEQQEEISSLKYAVIGHRFLWFVGLEDKVNEYENTRIDSAHERVCELQNQLNAICVHLNITLRGKDEMPEFDVVEKEEESEKE